MFWGFVGGGAHYYYFNLSRMQVKKRKEKKRKEEKKDNVLIRTSIICLEGGTPCENEIEFQVAALLDGVELEELLGEEEPRNHGDDPPRILVCHDVVDAGDQLSGVNENRNNGERAVLWKHRRHKVRGEKARKHQKQGNTKLRPWTRVMSWENHPRH